MIKGNTIYPVSHIDDVRQSIKKNRTNRLLKQHEKMQHAQAWIHEKDCLRKNLYIHFQESFEQVETMCCSNCDEHTYTWNLQATRKQRRNEQSWQVKLKQLLYIEVKDDTRRAH